MVKAAPSTTSQPNSPTMAATSTSKPFPGTAEWHRQQNERLLSDDVDLNTVSERDLYVPPLVTRSIPSRLRPTRRVKAKALMDEDYKKNIVSRGDEGYVYDKEVDFGDAESDASWD